MHRAIAFNQQRFGKIHFLRGAAPASAARDEQRLGAGIRQHAGARAMRQYGGRLNPLYRLAVTRVDQVAIALAAEFKLALVIARRADSFAVMQLQRSKRPRLARMLDADAPGAVTVLPQRQHVAANIDQRIADALPLQ